MKNKIFKVVLYLFFVGLAILLLLVFIPRTYEVPPFQAREGTQYWELPTGSRIGYTYIPAKGEKQPYPIIYLHGGPGGRVGDLTIKHLSLLSEDGYDIYLYDQIGSGHSDRLKQITEYTVDRHQKDLSAIIQTIGADKVILLGQSWGAMLAAVFASVHPEKVEKIIFTGPGPMLPVRYELANMPAPDSLYLKAPHYSNRQGNAKAQNFRSEAITKWAYIFGRKLASDHEADDFATYLFSELNKSAVSDTSQIQKATGGAGYYAHIMTLNSFDQVPDRRAALQQSTIPALLMRGQYDNQKWGYAQEYLELFTDHNLVIIPGAGHFIDVAQPELYLQTIRSFLNR